MKKLQTLLLSAAVLLSHAMPPGRAEPVKAESLNPQERLSQEARQIVQSFVGELKPRLIGAIQAGGFEQAVAVCSIEAPQIGQKLSEASGWSVKRVSLKPRNLSSATPDEFEKRVLEQFDQSQKKGEDARAFEFAELTDGQFRYMKAQKVEAICLNCHGVTLSAEIKKALENHYPEDSATGYDLGEVRGAFSLVKNF